jgi:hypothetical protein
MDVAADTLEFVQFRLVKRRTNAERADRASATGLLTRLDCDQDTLHSDSPKVQAVTPFAPRLPIEKHSQRIASAAIDADQAPGT